MNDDLISRSALKEEFAKHEDRKGYLIGDWEELIDNAPPVERPTGEWIPVSEGLPPRNGVYNVTRKLKEGETIYFISDASYFDGQNTWHSDNRVNHGRPYLNDVIAWMPRPEPYKEVENE